MISASPLLAIRPTICSLLICLLVTVWAGCRRHTDVDTDMRTNQQVRVVGTLRAPDLLLSETINEVGEATKVNCPFEVVNSSPLSIPMLVTETGCKCYGILVNGRTLNTGDTLDLKPFETISAMIHADAPLSTGKKTFTAKVQLGSHADPLITPLQGEVTIFPDLLVTPRILNIDVAQKMTFSESKIFHIEQNYRSHEQEEFDFYAEKWPDWATLRSMSKIDDVPLGNDGLRRGGWEIVVDIEIPPATPRQSDPFHLPIRICRVNGTHSRTIDIQIGMLSPRPLVYANRVFMGNGKVGDPVVRVFRVVSPTQEEFELELVLDEQEDWVSARIEKLSADEYQVEVVATPLKAGEFSSKLVLKTSLDSAPTITVDLTGRAIQ